MPPLSALLPFSCPLVTNDARYRAARKMKQNGQHLNAIHMLNNLVDRAEEEFGESSIETAAVHYELGHALFLNSSSSADACADVDVDVNVDVNANADINVIEESLEYMAKACAVLFTHVHNRDIIDTTARSNDATSTVAKGAHDNNMNEDRVEHEHPDANIKIDESQDTTPYSSWAKDQLPRVLIGIGNIYSYQNKHAEAIEVFLNAIPYREEAVNQCKDTERNSSDMNTVVDVKRDIASLRTHRLLAEVCVLLAEEFVMCPAGKDQVHGETQNIIVKGDEIHNLAKSYYDQGKDKLQDIVYMMANIEQQGRPTQLESEKQDVCHLATILTDVGMELARLDEESSFGNSKVPVAKKRRV